MKKLNLLAVGSLAMLMSLTSVSADAKSDFKTCIESEQNATCKLTGDIENLDAFITVNRNVTIDLDGHKITRNTGTVIFDVKAGTVTFTGNGTVDHSSESGGSNALIVEGTGSVVIENGTFKSTGNGIIIQGDGTNTVTVNDGEITGTNFGIVIASDKKGNIVVNDGTIKGESGIAISNGNDKSTVVINGGTITATKDNAVSIAGKGSTLEINNGTIEGVYGVGIFGENVTADIKGGKITAEAFAVSGNGSDTKTSTINITGGTLESTENAAIYHPQSGTLAITGGDITGKIGIVARGGQVNVSEDAHIVATGNPDEEFVTGDATDEQGKVKLPGGVGIIVDNTENYPAGSVKATVTGGNFETTGDAVQVYKVDTLEDEPTDLIEVKGGTFDQDVDPIYLNTEVKQSESGVVGKLHNITTEESENGKVIVPKNAAEGEVVTIGFEPSEGYKVSKVYVDGKEITANEDESYTFTMGEEDTKITAEFVSIEASSSIPTESEPEPENPSTLDKAPLYLALGTIALTGVAALGYSIKKKFEN